MGLCVMMLEEWMQVQIALVTAFKIIETVFKNRHSKKKEKKTDIRLRTGSEQAQVGQGNDWFQTGKTQTWSKAENSTAE